MTVLRTIMINYSLSEFVSSRVNSSSFLLVRDHSQYNLSLKIYKFYNARRVYWRVMLIEGSGYKSCLLQVFDFM